MRWAMFAGLLFLFQTADTRTGVEQRLWQYRNLGKAFYENPTTQVQAVEQFKHALDLAPQSAREQLNYGLALLRAGKTQEGVAQLQRVQKAHPELPHTWFNLGIVYKKDGDFDKALPQFAQMVKLRPNEPVSHYNLGVLYRQQGKLDDAVRQFEKAVELNHTLAAPHFQLYNVYRAQGKKEQAAAELRRFQELKKAQEGAAIPEDMEWCEYAEIYDPIDAPAPAARKQVAFEEKFFREKADGWVVLDAFGEGRADVLTWSNGRLHLYRHGTEEVPKFGIEDVTGVVSAAEGDFDNDGLMDLAVLTEKGPVLYRNMKGRFEKQEAALPSRRFEAAVWLDYDHDYDLDLFLLGEDSALYRNQGKAGFTDRTADFPFVKGKAIAGTEFRLVPDTKTFDLAVAYADRGGVLYRDLLGGQYGAEDYRVPEARQLRVTDSDHNGKLEVVAREFTPVDLNGDGAIDAVFADRVQLNRTEPKSNYITVQLSGIKNLKLAEGAEVEVKAATLYEKKVYDGVPLTFDLQDYKEADTVRITWPNGMIQNEIRQEANKAYDYKEAQRLSGSCPMIWTWNGREFQFITDVLGIAPLGAKSGDGTYFPVDHDEYIKIPGEALAARNGEYEVRVTEELSEVSYIDQLHLFAVDHPADEEFFLNEKWKAPPYPEFRYFGAKRRVYPKSAVDQAGRDVLQFITKADRRYPTGFRRTESGVAELHSLTLDFGDAAKENRAVLILNGWVDWADGSTFLAAAQESKEGLIPPYLQVKDGKGEWRTVIADMGMPDGKPKTIAVDLTGKFLSKSREVRIVTNLCVYWDEIFLSESSARPKVEERRMTATSAELSFRGFSKSKIDPERKQPDQYFYSVSSPTSYWNPTPGRYTRYGNVLPLLEAVDDRYVIMGSGDEMRLRFDAASLPPIASGWRRDFVLKVDGWAKDRDANTAYSQSVEPLPFHGMSGYPYPAREQYPADELHRSYLREYNTRPALRLIRPLAQ
jgi:tetratricopeptide (TPR) repeat protein